MNEEKHRIDIIQGEGGGGCFAAGTLISTPDGSINIEDISVGDEVYSFDDSGKISLNKVTKVFVHENNDIYSFKFWGGELLLNSIHWILNGRNTFFQAKHFDTDECVVDESGEFRPFKSLEFLRVGTVYNFCTENDHTYIANGVRVHNMGGGGGKGQVAQARTPVEDPEGIVYGDDKDDRFVSLSKLQIMDMVCEGPVKGLVRGGYKYEGSIGNIGYDTARFISYRSQIGAMEGITAEIEQKCSYGVKLLEKRENTITVQIRVESDATFYMNFKAHESPEPGKSAEGTKMWISSGPHNPTYPHVVSVTGPSSMPGFAPIRTVREAPAISDVNGGANFLSGNWKAYETWQAGKNHPNGPTAKSYDFVGTLPKIHDKAKIFINEVKGKWTGDVGGTAVSWVPYTTKNYSADLVTITQSPSTSNDYETILRVDPSEDNIEAEIDLPSKIVDGVVVGPASGRRVNPAWWAVTFTLQGESQVPICKLATDPPVNADEEEIITDGFEYLRSIFWNGIPILDSTGLLNFQQVSLNYTTGAPNGIRSDQAESLVKGTSKVRVAGEKLKGPTQELDEDDKLTGSIISDLDDFAQVFRISNKNCNGVTVNVRVGSLSVLLKEDQTLQGQPATHAVGTIDLGFAPVSSYGPNMIGRRTKIMTPATEASASSTGHGDDIEGGSGDLLRTSIIYIIQWKPVFDTIGEYREWPSLFRATKKYGTGPNSEITAEEETGQIEEVLWGKISYGYNKSTRINFGRHAELYNRAGFLGWEIRIIRTTPESISPSIQNTTYTDSIVEHYDVELSYPNSAAVTATFDAEYFSEPPGRSFDMEMLKVKVPSNYNPVLRTYGQNRGGCNETAFRTAFYSLTPFIYAGATTLPKGAVPDHAVSTINALGKGTVTEIVEANQDPNVQNPTRPVRLNTTGIYSPAIGGGMPLVSGADGYVNGTEDYWDGNFKSDLNGTIVKQYTNNPAWCFYDLITNRRYGLGNHIDSSLMDKWSLYEIGKYCDELVDDGNGGIEPRFTCNLLIGGREEAFKVLNDMSSVFRGMLYYHGGLIQAVQDSPKEPMYQFTNANVENGEFGYQSTSRKVRRNVAVIRYNDPDDEYKPAVEYVENLPEIKKFGIRELELTAFGCTSRGQARRLGNWALISESLETESCSFSVGLEGAYLRPGDVVQIFDYHRKQRAHGGRTQKFETVGLTGAKVTLDREITGLSGAYDTYKFSMLTPSHYLDPSLIDEGEMNSADSPEIRNSLIQSVYFTADQTRPVSGLTTVRFDYSTPISTGWNGRHGVAYAPEHITSSETYSDLFGDVSAGEPKPPPGGWTEAQIELNHLRADRTVTPTGKWPITGFNTFSHNLTGDTQFVWTIEKSGTRTPIDKNYSLYKLITIEEKDISKYNVRAIEHQTGKFVMAESGIAFDRTTYAQTPADPDSVLLDSFDDALVWEGPPNSIRYTIIRDEKDSATVGFQVYVISSQYGFSTLDVNPDGVPHSKYLAARVDNIDPQGYYIPSDEGLNVYWFRVFAVNAANDLSSNYVESLKVLAVPKLINNVIVSSLSLLNPLHPRLEEEDKSTGPGTDFAYNTDVSLHINTGPGVNFTEMTFATGQLLNSSPTFGWQAGFVGLKPGMKASTSFKYRLTIREPSTFGLTTEERDTLFTKSQTHSQPLGSPYDPQPSKNILYEITGLSATTSETKFIYHYRLNITEAKQTTILFDAHGDPIDPFVQSSIPGDGNPTMGIGGPYRDYDVVVEAHDDQGFSSATSPEGGGGGFGDASCLYRGPDGSRKDVEYSNGKGFDIMYVSNPRPGSLVLLDDVRNAALAIPAQDIQFTFNDDVIPMDAVGVVAWICSQPIGHDDLHHMEFTSARWNANRNGFLVRDYFGRLNADDYYGAYNSDNMLREDNVLSEDVTIPGAPIFRSLFSFENLSITDPKTASFNISSLIEESVFFTTAYVIIAIYDSFDYAEMTNFMETNGGASDINILSAQNLMCHNLILSKDNEGRGEGAAITDVVGQANKLVAYISVEAINKVEAINSVKWTHLGFSSYSVKRIGGAVIGRKYVMVWGRRVYQNEYAPETYEHTAHFNPDKVGFKSGDDYMIRISSNVLSVNKYPDASKEKSEPKTYNEQKIVWKSETKGHEDLDRAMTLDIYRI